MGLNPLQTVRIAAPAAQSGANASVRRARPTPGRTSRGIAIVALLSILATACGSADDAEAAQPTLPLPPETDVAYGPAAGCPGSDVECGGSQQLDIYRSDEPGPNPVLVFFHGGGFIIGDKSNSIPERLGPALDDGWDVVSANYRLATPDGANLFPAAVNDARRVIRWVKANADAQGWDASNVAVMGQSAGGNLAEMVAVTSDQPEFDSPGLPPELAAVDPSVIAAVAINPVSDLGLFASSDAGAGMVARYTGCTEDCAEVNARGSVQTHVDADAAPLLALHGAKDPLAAPEQGELVRAAYQGADLDDRFELIVVDDGPERFQGHDVDWGRFSDRFLEFLDRYRT